MEIEERFLHIKAHLENIIFDKSTGYYEKELKIEKEIIKPLLEESELLKDDGAVKKLQERVKQLEKENKDLQKRVTDAGWEREAAHADDWRKITEMGQC